MAGIHKGRQAGKAEAGVTASLLGASNPLNEEQRELLEWLRGVKFRKVTFGGVSEEDVWKKISELNARYDAVLRAERARNDALLSRQHGQVRYPQQELQVSKMPRQSGHGAGYGRHYA